MKTFCFINNKGGVGKTASVVTVAHMMASQYGKRVLVVDMDPQGNTSARFSEKNYVAIFQTILSGKRDAGAPLSVGDLLRPNSEVDIHDVILHTKYENLDIIPSDLTLSRTEQEMLMDIMHPQQTRLKKQLKQVQEEYDYCIIDCGPSTSLLNVNGLAASDEAFIPLRVDGDSCLGVAIVLNLIREVQEDSNPKLEVGGIFYTQYDARKGVSVESYQMMQSQFADMTLPIKIGVSKYMEENSYYKTQLLEVDSGARKNAVTTAYMRLTEYMMSSSRSKFLQEYEKEQAAKQANKKSKHASK